jgi:hypothetical protein
LKIQIHPGGSRTNFHLTTDGYGWTRIQTRQKASLADPDGLADWWLRFPAEFSHPRLSVSIRGQKVFIAWREIWPRV